MDNAQDIAMKYGVQSIPTFIMFKSGQIVDKMMGAVGAPGIHMICKKHSGLFNVCLRRYVRTIKKANNYIQKTQPPGMGIILMQ